MELLVHTMEQMKNQQKNNISHYVRELLIAQELQDQELINEAAKQLTDYLWRPSFDISYDELLASYGYEGGKSNAILK